jgi:hypothetical protein
MHNIPHFGNINVDRIISVSWTPPRWRFKNDRHINRPFLFWGKPYIERGWSCIEPATVDLRVGADEYIQRAFKPGEVERAYRQVADAVAAAQAGVQPERIVAAAIRRLELNRAWTPPDGELVNTHDWVTYTMPPPARHHTILHCMPSTETIDRTEVSGVTKVNVVGAHEQGFLTSTGRFVGRKQARVIAIKAGQVEPNGSKIASRDCLRDASSGRPCVSGRTRSRGNMCRRCCGAAGARGPSPPSRRRRRSRPATSSR